MWAGQLFFESYKYYEVSLLDGWIEVPKGAIIMMEKGGSRVICEYGVGIHQGPERTDLDHVLMKKV